MADAPTPSTCPICGEPNRCGLSEGKSQCWCFSALIPEAALERVPAEAKNLTCICARCAAAAERASASSSSPP